MVRCVTVCSGLGRALQTPAERRPGLDAYTAAQAQLSSWQRWLEIGRAQKRAFDAARRLPPEPRQVLLFAGHMVDAPRRKTPRFPRAKVAPAAARIAAVLDGLKAGPADLALTQGAAGGDLLFAEACVAREVPLQLLLPLPEPAFATHSLLASADGAKWRQRFEAIKRRCPDAPQVLGDVLTDAPPEHGVFEQCNLWLLATALAYGIGRLRFVCLWDGGGSDGPGGTRHLVDEVRRMGGQLSWIDVRTL